MKENKEYVCYMLLLNSHAILLNDFWITTGSFPIFRTTLLHYLAIILLMEK